jgi:hypothetical protein
MVEFMTRITKFSKQNKYNIWIIQFHTSCNFVCVYCVIRKKKKYYTFLHKCLKMGKLFKYNIKYGSYLYKLENLVLLHELTENVQIYVFQHIAHWEIYYCLLLTLSGHS